MTQRQIILNAYPLLDCGPNSYSVSIGLGEKTPSKTVAIETVADCRAALAIFAKELEATNKPWHVSVMFDKRSGRKPRLFDKAKDARELECHVNPHLAAKRAA